MAKITGGLWGRITGAKMDKTEVKTAEKVQTKEKKKAKIPKVYQMYVGNTLRLVVPQIEGKEVIKSSHQVGDPSVAGVIHGVLMGRKGGETTVSSQFVYADENGQEETVRYEVRVQILVGKLKLKCNPATVYRMDGAQSLEERTSMSVAVGKTARIVPALDYGIFSSMRYEVEEKRCCAPGAPPSSGQKLVCRQWGARGIPFCGGGFLSVSAVESEENIEK